MKRLLFLFLAVTSAAAAEVTPLPGARDARVQSIDYDADQVVRLRTAPGYALSVELSPDERIETIAIGTSAGWQVTATKRADRLFIKQEMSAADTNLTVITDARRYLFALAPSFGADPQLPFSVRFTYPGLTSAPIVEVERARGSYRVHGAKALRPIQMSDDGVATSILWPKDLDLPAVYALDASGREAIVNGAMRDGRFVVDMIAPKFVFRSGRNRAVAVRKPAGRVK